MKGKFLINSLLSGTQYMYSHTDQSRTRAARLNRNGGIVDVSGRVSLMHGKSWRGRSWHRKCGCLRRQAKPVSNRANPNHTTAVACWLLQVTLMPDAIYSHLPSSLSLVIFRLGDFFFFLLSFFFAFAWNFRSFGSL